MTWYPLIDIGGCPPGTAHELVVAGRIVALFNVDGNYYALDGVCPHQGGPLGRGVLTGCIVTCPWHGWQFNVQDGQHQLSPSICHPSLSIKCGEGKIWVEL